ncbi:MAG: SGNH/GDSL hydrolase family protein [Verrucomicrobia bacterium]|nr:SGNH/GDSL hydrolase family protein [Verrucomicrobiota bacterium]
MKSAFRKLLFTFAAAALLAASAVAGEFFFKDGDRVVFLGDSITEQRLYTTYIEAYTLTRHPEWKLWFRNVGWGGDTSWLRQRAHPDEKQLFAADEAAQQKMVEESVGRGLRRDVLPLKPTAITIKFGMNDHSYQKFREDIFKTYVRSQSELAKVLEANGARVAFLTSQPIEDKRPDPDKDIKNQSLRQFSDGLKAVAAKQNATFVDQFDPYMAIMMHERVADPAAFIGGGDAVHPGPAGHTIMAWAVLKGLGATALVSRAEIDGAAGKLLASEGCQVTNLKAEPGTVAFDRVDAALPMPIDPKAEPALKLAPILQDLNQYELKVAGLPAGDYQLSIDGEAVGKASSEDLAKGWNIATTAGPITKQAREVLALVFKKNDIFFRRWRTVQLFEFPDWAQKPEALGVQTAEIARLDGQIAEAEAQIDDARKPKPHHFELRKL